MSDPHGLCRLIEGEVQGWRGLPTSKPMSRSDLPDCLGPVSGTDQRAYLMGTFNVERHQPGGKTRVDVYSWWGDGRVTFLEVWPAPALAASSVLDALPPPESSYLYGAVEREMWEVVAPAEVAVEELVWGSRGLSLVTIRTEMSDVVARIRGFGPMSSDVWIEGFVKFTATPEV